MLECWKNKEEGWADGWTDGREEGRRRSEVGSREEGKQYAVGSVRMSEVGCRTADVGDRQE
jgi:hypothetical protein